MNVTNLSEEKRFFDDKFEYTKDEIVERAKKLDEVSLVGDKTAENLELKYPIYNDHIKIIYFKQIKFDELERKIYKKGGGCMFPVKKVGGTI